MIILVENILYCKTTNVTMLLAKEFECKNDLFNTPCRSSILNIYKVKQLSPLKIFYAKDIFKKCVLFPYFKSDEIVEGEYIVFPLIHA